MGTKKLAALSILALTLILSSLACANILVRREEAGAPAVKAGGEFRLLGAEPPTLDPALSGDATSAEYIVEIFSGLVTLNPKLEVVPDIAERWEISPDGKTYTFFLRKGVKFHDGKEVTAKDFKYSLERAADPKTGSTTADTYLADILGVKEKLAGKANEVRGVKVVDDYTLQIEIDAPKAYFIAKLTYPAAFVLDRANVESGKNWTDRPNGTGPFKLKEWSRGEKIVLVRNENYYAGPPPLAQVRFILAGGSPMTMYENNEIDTTGVSLTDIDRVLDPKNPLNKELVVATSLDVGYIGFDVTKPPFDDVRVRQAFNHAVDKQKIVDVVLKKLVQRADGVLPPGMPGYNPNLKGLEYDPAKAKRLIAESKYKDVANFPPIVVSLPGTGATLPPSSDAILQMWKDNLGVKVEIQQAEWATFLQDIKAHKYQVFELGWIADYPDPQDFLDVLFHSQSLENNGRYSNPQVDALLERARVEKDVSTRLRLYQEVEQMIVNDAPWIPLSFGKSYMLIKPYVKGYQSPPMVIPNLRFVSIEK